MDKIKAIIFDFDGVILESMDVKTRAFANLFKNCSEKQIEAIIVLHKNHSGLSRFEKFKIIYQDILKQPLTEEKEKLLGEQFSRDVYEQVLSSPFVGGAEEFLEKYHKIFPLFIASGTPDGEMKSIIKDKGLEKYFKEVYGSPDKKKDIILKIMKNFYFKAEELVFVGDSIDDEEGARGAGVRFVRRIKENNPFQELENLISC